MDVQSAFLGHDCGHSTESIADYIGSERETSTISTACSSSANTIMQAGRLIKIGRTDIAVAGGTDALSIFTLNGCLGDDPVSPTCNNLTAAGPACTDCNAANAAHLACYVPPAGAQKVPAIVQSVFDGSNCNLCHLAGSSVAFNF